MAALIRRAEAAGDSAMLLHRGDPDRGALLLVVIQRGEYRACLERQLAMSGDYCWFVTGPATDSTAESRANHLSSRLKFDPDSWAIELNVADAERFIAETIATG